MELQAVVFDLDGTLLDTLQDLTDSVNAAMTYFCLPTHTSQQVRRMVGDGIFRLMERAVPSGTVKPLLEQVYHWFLPYYQAHCMEGTKPYPGISELLNSLQKRGMTAAVVSNKADAAVQTLKEHFFPGLLEAAIGESSGIPRKPAPDMLLAALNKLNCPAEKAVYVGDSEVDLQTAARAGLRCISAAWGFRTREQLLQAGAGLLADTPQELQRILLRR